MKSILSSIIVVLGWLLVLTAQAAAQEKAEGEVYKTVTTGIVLLDANKAEVKYWWNHKSTFTPAGWRPEEGDKVAVSFNNKTSRNGKGEKLVFTNLELIKASPQKVDSPVVGVVARPGKKWLEVKISDNATIKFEFSRESQHGYNPEAGQKVKVNFTKTPSRNGCNFVYLINQIELVK